MFALADKKENEQHHEAYIANVLILCDYTALHKDAGAPRESLLKDTPVTVRFIRLLRYTTSRTFGSSTTLPYRSGILYDYLEASRKTRQGGTTVVCRIMRVQANGDTKKITFFREQNVENITQQSKGFTPYYEKSSKKRPTKKHAPQKEAEAVSLRKVRQVVVTKKGREVATSINEKQFPEKCRENQKHAATNNNTRGQGTRYPISGGGRRERKKNRKRRRRNFQSFLEVL